MNVVKNSHVRQKERPTASLYILLLWTLRDYLWIDCGNWDRNKSMLYTQNLNKIKYKNRLYTLKQSQSHLWRKSISIKALNNWNCWVNSIWFDRIPWFSVLCKWHTYEIHTFVCVHSTRNIMAIWWLNNNRALLLIYFMFMVKWMDRLEFSCMLEKAPVHDDGME